MQVSEHRTDVVKAAVHLCKPCVFQSFSRDRTRNERSSICMLVASTHCPAACLAHLATTCKVRTCLGHLQAARVPGTVPLIKNLPNGIPERYPRIGLRTENPHPELKILTKLYPSEISHLNTHVPRMSWTHGQPTGQNLLAPTRVLQQPLHGKETAAADSTTSPYFDALSILLRRT